jgi:thiol-disulfide isomerase/thioredoxin
MKHILIAAALMIGFAGVTHGAGKAGGQAPDFPPGLFIDGRHYSLKDLEGKAVVLFFYEQDCPTCRGLIPKRNEVVEAYKDKPIKFIAVAAGDSIADAKAYVASTKLEMPVFADNLSLMEKRYGEKISLQNIYQFRVIGPDGVVREYRMEPAAIDQVLSQVKWKYKDGGYDARLNVPLNLLEWGQYADGMRVLKPFLKNSNKDLAASAKKLYDVIHAEGEQWLTSAQAAEQAENMVEAFDLYTKVANTFVGDDLAKKAAEPLKKLMKSQPVKDELAARQMYEQLCIGTSRAQPQQRNAVAQFAASIAAKYPKAPTGEKAAEIAKEIEGQ